jgi:hypothetical protein
MQIRRLISVTAAAVACAAPAASASPTDPVAPSRAPMVVNSYATIAAHRDAMASRWQQAERTAAKPILDNSDSSTPVPAIAAIAGLSLLGLLLVQVAGKGVARRRHAARVDVPVVDSAPRP